MIIRFMFGSLLTSCHTKNRPSPDKFRVAPPSSLCNSKAQSEMGVAFQRRGWLSRGLLTAARDTTSDRAAGRSKH
jgi:hypothetical protein